MRDDNVTGGARKVRDAIEELKLVANGLRELNGVPDYRDRNLSLAITYVEDGVLRLIEWEDERL